MPIGKVARFVVSSLVDLLNEHTPLSPPFGGLVVVLALFGLAWLVSRGAGRLATFIVLRAERKHALGVEDSGVIASLKQRETAISLARTTVRFLAYALAALLSFGVLLGADKVQTVAGASFLVIILAFAAQRFPTGPTHFIRPPSVAETDRLEDDLHRIRAVAAVPVGREWLAEDLLPSLVAERAPDALVVHGPVVMWADEHAEHRFARATRTPVAARRSRQAS